MLGQMLAAALFEVKGDSAETNLAHLWVVVCVVCTVRSRVLECG
jgi:hypothetical protein